MLTLAICSNRSYGNEESELYLLASSYEDDCITVDDLASFLDAHGYNAESTNNYVTTKLSGGKKIFLVPNGAQPGLADLWMIPPFSLASQSTASRSDPKLTIKSDATHYSGAETNEWNGMIACDWDKRLRDEQNYTRFADKYKIYDPNSITWYTSPVPTVEIYNSNSEEVQGAGSDRYLKGPEENKSVPYETKEIDWKFEGASTSIPAYEVNFPSNLHLRFPRNVSLNVNVTDLAETYAALPPGIRKAGTSRGLFSARNIELSPNPNPEDVGIATLLNMPNFTSRATVQYGRNMVFWNCIDLIIKYTDQQNRAVLYHELGHVLDDGYYSQSQEYKDAVAADSLKFKHEKGGEAATVYASEYAFLFGKSNSGSLLEDWADTVKIYLSIKADPNFHNPAYLAPDYLQNRFKIVGRAIEQSDVKMVQLSMNKITESTN
jgi:hypothetical protein